MKTATKFAAALLAGSVLTAPAMAQDLSFNAGVTSNYIWRGMTQTNDNPAFQAGADLGFDSGFYLGTWASNVDFGDDTTYEWDVYGGYAGEANGISYDIGYIAYIYDGNEDLDFAEVYASIGAGGVSFSMAYQVDNDGDEDLNHLYYNLGYETEIGAYTVGVSAGIYDYDGDNADEVNDYALTISKDEFTLAITDTDLTDSDPEVSLSYGIEF